MIFICKKQNLFIYLVWQEGTYDEFLYERDLHPWIGKDYESGDASRKGSLFWVRAILFSSVREQYCKQCSGCPRLVMAS
jgi:hypothetical protein